MHFFLWTRRRFVNPICISPNVSCNAGKKPRVVNKQRQKEFSYISCLLKFTICLFLRWRPAQGRDLGKYRSRHVAVNHKTDMRKDSKMALDINNVNVNIEVNFGQVSA